MTTKRIKLESTPTPPSPVAEDGDHCIICLQDIIDRTVLPACAHDCFCFDCVVVWTEQSRKCPLCQQAIGSYLVHHVRSQFDSIKFYLPPLRSSPSLDPPTRPGDQRHPNTRSARIRTWGRREARREEDAEHRALERRKWVYRHRCYAKHVASNSYTKYRPYPTPAQFSSQPDLVTRTTAFVRRELMVWDNIDADFLTTFVVSLMKSIDLRSEVAIKLLSEFLDMGNPYVEGNRYPNAEHFAHEVYSYIRSPFRELNVYDDQVQYDRPDTSSSALVMESQPKRVRTRPPLNVNESLTSRAFRPPSHSRLDSRRPTRSDSPNETDEHRSHHKRLRSPSRDRTSQRSGYRSPSRDRGRREGSRSSPLRSRSQSPSPSGTSRLQGQRRVAPSSECDGQRHCSRKLDVPDIPVTVASNSGGPEEDEPRKERAPPRAPRQTALSSIHEHLGLGGPRQIRIDRRPLEERMARIKDIDVSNKTTDQNGSNTAPAVAAEEIVSMDCSPPADDRTSQIEVRPSSEVMALTRARLAALKAQTQPDSNSPSTQRANALRVLLFARLEEEKKRVAAATEQVEVRPDAEERRLRLAAKLAAEKRRASSLRVSLPVQ